jgi:hypothetical protein
VELHCLAFIRFFCSVQRSNVDDVLSKQLSSAAAAAAGGSWGLLLHTIDHTQVKKGARHDGDKTLKNKLKK